MASLTRWLLLTACFVTIISADDIDRVGRKAVVTKLLREMVNQTKADTLNLPANASSIRENITDTFSCENRTYGYYADVDNECQIFHVCLTSQSASGRNTTYRWSFICPNETIFNQEVLTCTRPRDSIDCEESPMFYHLNMEIGKVSNETEQNEANKETESKPQRRRPVKKQNLIVDELMKEVKKENLIAEELDEELIPVVVEEVEGVGDMSPEVEKVQENRHEKREKVDDQSSEFEEVKEKRPEIHEVNAEYVMKGKRMENARLSSERSLKRRGRKISRGSYRFKVIN